MRIALLHYTLPPVIGGVERVLAQQAAALRALGHEVEWLDAEGWRARSGAWDAVIVHNVMTMPFDLEWRRELLRAAAGQRTVRWLNWVHDVAACNPAYAGLGVEVRGELTAPMPGFLHVAVSEVRRGEFAEAMGLAATEVRLVPNGLDWGAAFGWTGKLNGLVDARRLGEADVVLMHPTRLVRRKRIEFGLAVVAAGRALGRSVLYAVTAAGDPHQADGVAYLEFLRAEARKLGVEEWVVWMGAGEQLEDGEVRALAHVADALFFPSAAEGYGLPLVEALAWRLPIWCSDLPVHREVAGVGAEYFSLADEAEVVVARMLSWSLAGGLSERRRHLLRLETTQLCKERLEPLLTVGNGCA